MPCSNYWESWLRVLMHVLHVQVVCWNTPDLSLRKAVTDL
jgi:hypothetical protein